MYRRFSEAARLNLHAVQETITSANGTPSSVEGKTEFNLTIDKKTYHNEAVVTDIKVDGIFGLDFLMVNNCTIDTSNEVLSIHERDIKKSIEGYLGCVRITSTVSIHPQSEIIIPGKVCLPDGSILPANDSIIEIVYKKIMRGIH